MVTASAARAEAGRGAAPEALAYLPRLVPWLEHAPVWTITFPRMACLAAEVLWIFGRRDHAGVIERALREKVVAPDFRYAMVDGRLALAQLCALTDRGEEAVVKAERWLEPRVRTGGYRSTIESKTPAVAQGRSGG